MPEFNNNPFQGFHNVRTMLGPMSATGNPSNNLAQNPYSGIPQPNPQGTATPEGVQAAAQQVSGEPAVPSPAAISPQPAQPMVPAGSGGVTGVQQSPLTPNQAPVGMPMKGAESSKVVKVTVERLSRDPVMGTSNEVLDKYGLRADKRASTHTAKSPAHGTKSPAHGTKSPAHGTKSLEYHGDHGGGGTKQGDIQTHDRRKLRHTTDLRLSKLAMPMQQLDASVPAMQQQQPPGAAAAGGMGGAMLGPMIGAPVMGSAVGYGMAPQGHGMQGAMRGAGHGLGAGMGGMIGAPLGAMAATPIAGMFSSPAAQLAALGLGGVAGGLGGAYLGSNLAGNVMGDPDWEEGQDDMDTQKFVMASDRNGLKAKEKRAFLGPAMKTLGMSLRGAGRVGRFTGGLSKAPGMGSKILKGLGTTGMHAGGALENMGKGISKLDQMGAAGLSRVGLGPRTINWNNGGMSTLLKSLYNVGARNPVSTGVTGAGLGYRAWPKEGEMKATKQEANYHHADGHRKCGNCMYFGKNSCSKVEGDISADMICKYFAKEKRANESPLPEWLGGAGLLGGGFGAHEALTHYDWPGKAERFGQSLTDTLKSLGFDLRASGLASSVKDLPWTLGSRFSQNRKLIDKATKLSNKNRMMRRLGKLLMKTPELARAGRLGGTGLAYGLIPAGAMAGTLAGKGLDKALSKSSEVSAVGESGLSMKGAPWRVDGKDAWDISQYTKSKAHGQDPHLRFDKKAMSELPVFSQAFFTNCEKAGMTLQDIESGIDKLSETFGERIGEILEDGLERLKKAEITEKKAVLGVLARGVRAIPKIAPRLLGGAAKSPIARSAVTGAGIGGVAGGGVGGLQSADSVGERLGNVAKGVGAGALGGAAIGGGASAASRFLPRFAGGAARGSIPTAGAGASRAVGGTASKAIPGAAGRTLKQAPGVVGGAGRRMMRGLRSGAGAGAGYGAFGGGLIGNMGTDPNASWGERLGNIGRGALYGAGAGALGGAGLGAGYGGLMRYAPRVARPMKNMAAGGVTGGFIGSGLDEGLGLMGIDTGGSLSMMGALGGAGLRSPWAARAIRGMAPGAAKSRLLSAKRIGGQLLFPWERGGLKQEALMTGPLVAGAGANVAFKGMANQAIDDFARNELGMAGGKEELIDKAKTFSEMGDYGNLLNIADPILTLFGMDPSSMPMMNKFIMLMSILAMVGGAATGSSGMGLMGGLGLGASMLPMMGQGQEQAAPQG